MNNGTELTNELRKSIEIAKRETERLLNKELKYSYDLRKHDRVAYYQNHLQYLTNMLDTNKWYND